MITNIIIPLTNLENRVFWVRVETYNDITYEKGYPENDVIRGNEYDHDIYLDMVGGFLGVPRKQYVEYNVNDASKAYPPYFRKGYHYVKDWTLYYAACTEDDYYYSQRLKQFLKDKKTSVLNAFIRARYDKQVITVSGDNILLEDLQRHFPDFVQEHNITQEWLDNNRYGLYTVYVSNKEVPVNYKNTFTNDDVYLDIKRFLPCTRLSLISDMKPINFTYQVIGVNPRMGRFANRKEATIKFKFDTWQNLDFTYTVDGEENSDRTDANGEYIFTVESYDQKKTYHFTVTTDGRHGELPVSETFDITIICYDIDQNRYASHDEVDYTYSSSVRPVEDEVNGYSYILEDEYYEE